jgi:hypothetical protein
MPGQLGLFTLPILNLVGIISVNSFTTNRLVSYGDSFFRVLSFILVPSLIIWFLIFFDLQVDYSKVYVESGEKSWNLQFYRYYPGSIFLDHLIYSFNSVFISRLQGVFDEPGYLGTISALYLCARNLKLTCRTSKLFFVVGCLSLSLAFYFIILAYYLLNCLFNFKVKSMLIALCFALIAISAVPTSTMSELPLISRVYNNIENIENIDNRTNTVFEDAFNDYVEGPVSTLMFGLGNAAHTQLGVGLSSVKSLFYS